MVSWTICFLRSHHSTKSFERVAEPIRKCSGSATAISRVAQDATLVFLWYKTLTREKITDSTRIQFPVGTQKFGECILSTSQAGLHRRARVSRRTDHPSYRESGPLGCNFLSRKCLIPKKHSSSILPQDATRVFLWYKTLTREKITAQWARFPVGEVGSSAC